MHETTLWICKSCQISQGTEGEILLNDLAKVSPNRSWQLEPVSCLLTCRQACSAAVIGTGKCTYLFTKLTLDCVPSLAHFMELYVASVDGVLSWNSIPKDIKACIARIPTIGQIITDEE